jgi:hypothetical protein
LKTYQLADVLSVVLGRIVSDRHIDAIYDVLGYMTGTSVFTHQIPRLGKPCSNEIIRQFPEFSNIEVADLVAIAESFGNNDTRMDLIRDWVTTTKEKYHFAESYDIEAFSEEQQKKLYNNPLTELEDMVGPERVIAVVDGTKE